MSIRRLDRCVKRGGAGPVRSGPVRSGSIDSQRAVPSEFRTTPVPLLPFAIGDDVYYMCRQFMLARGLAGSQRFASFN